MVSTGAPTRTLIFAGLFDFARNVALQASKAQYLTRGGGPDDCAAWNGGVELAGAVAGIDLEALLERAVENLGQGRLGACRTCLFFVAGWPTALNGVWKKALESGLGVGVLRSGVWCWGRNPVRGVGPLDLYS